MALDGAANPEIPPRLQVQSPETVGKNTTKSAYGTSFANLVGDVGGIVKTRKGSWLALLAFCTTAAIVSALGLATLFASATVAFAVAQTYDGSAHAAWSDHATRTISGMLTDSRCGARHPMNSGKTTAECVRACVQKGAGYTLVDGDRKYTLVGNKEQLAKLAGQRVTVIGHVEGNNIQVSAVDPEHLSKH
jgi:hypothetical protein